MNKQETFDKVVTHLLTQGEKSFRGEFCAYRGSGGYKCAIGCLISEDQYCVDLEGKTAKNRDIINAVKASLGQESILGGWGILIDLQKIHDFIDPEDWFMKLKVFAEANNLNTKALEPFECEA